MVTVSESQVKTIPKIILHFLLLDELQASNIFSYLGQRQFFVSLEVQEILNFITTFFQPSKHVPAQSQQLKY